MPDLKLSVFCLLSTRQQKPNLKLLRSSSHIDLSPLLRFNHSPISEGKRGKEGRKKRERETKEERGKRRKRFGTSLVDSFSFPLLGARGALLWLWNSGFKKSFQSYLPSFVRANQQMEEVVQHQTLWDRPSALLDKTQSGSCEFSKTGIFKFPKVLTTDLAIGPSPRHFRNSSFASQQVRKNFSCTTCFVPLPFILLRLSPPPNQRNQDLESFATMECFNLPFSGNFSIFRSWKVA